MNINNIEKIHELVGNETFNLSEKIVNELYEYIKPNYNYNNITQNINAIFNIPSINLYKEYITKLIISKNGKIEKHDCNCKKYLYQGICEHVVASIIIVNNEKNEIFKYLNIKQEKNIHPLIQEFENTNTPKQKIELNIELIKESIRSEKGYYEVKIEIGSYALKKNINEFYETYYLGHGSIVFGKNFIYNPKKYYFNDSDKYILDILPLILTQKNTFKQDLYSIDNNYLTTYSYKAKMLFDCLRKYNKCFVLTLDDIRYEITSINDDFSPIIDIIKENKTIGVRIDINDIVVLTDDYSYIFLNENIYYLDNNKSKIIKNLVENKNIEFNEDEEKDFENIVLPKLRTLSKKINFSSNISNKYKIDTPTIKLYFDKYEEGIICNVKCKYGDIVIDVLDNNTNINNEIIIRDKVEEQKAIDYLFDLGFYINNYESAFCIDDEDKIIEFIDYILPNIDSYEVFVTENLKNIKYIKRPIIKSSFSLDKGELLKCNISLEGIDNNEIESLMESVRYKKKYYKLKNGNYVNIENNNELQQLDNMLLSLNIDYDMLNNNDIIIPKYKALYINSIKNNFVSTSDALKKFVKDYKEAINKDIDLLQPNNTTLRDYQELGVKWLLALSNVGFGGILADEMGLGKTLQTIMFISQRLKIDNTREMLIVCPTSLIYNWESEFNKYAPNIRVKVIADVRKKRERIFDELKDYEVFITSYGLLREDIEKYKKINYDTMILDEAQTIKNVNALITKSVKQISASTKIALTGTPIENSILELYSIFDFIMPGFFGSINKFQNKYNDILKPENKELKDDFLRLISPFILRRKKKNVIKELPDKIDNNVLIELSNDEKKLYLSEVNKITKNIKDNIRNDSFNSNKMIILQELTRLRQLCISPNLCIDGYNGISSKISSLVDIITSAISEGHKILVFSQFTSALSILKERLIKNNIKYYYLDGKTKSNDRLKLVDDFNKNNNIFVFLISLKAGGNGLNLVGADIVIHLDPWWNPAVEEQATDRAHRIGQKNVVQVIKLIAKGTIEEKIIKLQNIKKDLSNQIIEGEERDKFTLKNLTEDDLLYLLEN